MRDAKTVMEGEEIDISKNVLQKSRVDTTVHITCSFFRIHVLTDRTECRAVTDIVSDSLAFQEDDWALLYPFIDKVCTEVKLCHVSGVGDLSLN